MRGFSPLIRFGFPALAAVLVGPSLPLQLLKWPQSSEKTLALHVLVTRRKLELEYFHVPKIKAWGPRGVPWRSSDGHGVIGHPGPLGSCHVAGRSRAPPVSRRTQVRLWGIDPRNGLGVVFSTSAGRPHLKPTPRKSQIHGGLGSRRSAVRSACVFSEREVGGRRTHRGGSLNIGPHLLYSLCRDHLSAQRLQNRLDELRTPKTGCYRRATERPQERLEERYICRLCF